MTRPKKEKKIEAHNRIKLGLFRGPFFRETLSILEFQREKESLTLLSH